MSDATGYVAAPLLGVWLAGALLHGLALVLLLLSRGLLPPSPTATRLGLLRAAGVLVVYSASWPIHRAAEAVAWLLRTATAKWTGRPGG